MIKLQLLTGIAGNNFSYVRGDEMEWQDELDATRMIAAGQAKPADAASKARYEELKGQLVPPKVSKKPHRPIPTDPKPPVPEPAPPENHDSVPVTVLDLDEDTIAALEASGLETVGDVLSHPDLTEIRGVGKATAAKILKAAAAV